MKKTIIFIIITILLMLGLAGTIYYFYDLNQEKDILTVCSLTFDTSENEKVNVEYEITSEVDGTIISVDKYIKNEYANEETYEVASEYYSSLENYELDDIEMVISSKEEIYLVDETWSKAYIESLESLEYICIQEEL